MKRKMKKAMASLRLIEKFDRSEDKIGAVVAHF